MAKLYYTWSQYKKYEPLEYSEYPQGFVYICIQTTNLGESPVSAPLKWKLAFGSSFPGTVSSITATLPIAVSPDPITTTGTVTSSMATNKLIGRYTAGTGVMQEITIGSGLTLSGGGTLSASIGSIGWLLDGNTVGSEKWIGTIDNFDFPIRTNNVQIAEFSAAGNFGIGVAPNAAYRLHSKGSGTTSATYNLFAESNDGYSLSHNDDGQIFRTGQLWSMATSVGQGLTTWGEAAGGSSSTGDFSTMVGFRAGAAVAGNGCSAFGAYALYVTTEPSNTGIGFSSGRNHTTGHSCTYLGYSAGYPAGAGDNVTGSYSMAIGTYSLIGGSFDNVLSIHGVGTAANQIVIGGATNINNAAFCYYTDIYLGRGVTNSAPATFTYHSTDASGTDTNGANTIRVVSRATGSGTSGDMIWQYAPSGSTGTTLTTATTGMTFKGTTGQLQVVNGVSIGTAGSVLGLLKLNGNTSGTVTINTAAAAGTWTLTLPTTDGNAGEYLQTDGAGVTTWAAGSVTLPLNEIAFGTGAGITSSSEFTWNNATSILSVGGVLIPRFIHTSLSGGFGVVDILDYLTGAFNGTGMILDDDNRYIDMQAYGTDGVGINGYFSVLASPSNVILIKPGAATTPLRFLELTINGTNYVAFKAPDAITTSVTWTLPSTDSTGTQALVSNGSGVLSWASIGGGGTVTSVSGTANRITSTGGATPVIDISASYVGQTSITTLGTVTTGTLSTGAIIGGVTMTLGSDATGDIYYRNAGGVLTRLAIGSNTDILTVTAGLPSWTTTPTAGANTALSNLASVAINTTLLPGSNDGAALGSGTLSFSDLFLASGGLINFANGNSVITHSSAVLTVSTGDLRVTTAGTNAASVATLDGTQTLTNKTITASTNVLGTVTMTLGSDATGDVYYRSGGSLLTRLAIGSTGDSLTVVSGIPAWSPKGYDLTSQTANGVTVGSGATVYAAPFFGGSFNATEGNRQLTIKVAGTVGNLYVRTNSAQSGLGSLVITVRKNGADTAVTLTIAAGSAAATFSDVANTVAFAAGDLIGFKVVNNAAATSANIMEVGVFVK